MENEDLFKKFNVTEEERGKYVFDELRDFQILDFCRKLEQFDLSPSDKEAIGMAKSQIEDDWRAPLLKYLGGLLQRYQK